MSNQNYLDEVNHIDLKFELIIPLHDEMMAVVTDSEIFYLPVDEIID
jgi:hypothetical protein